MSERALVSKIAIGVGSAAAFGFAAVAGYEYWDSDHSQSPDAQGDAA